MPFGAREHPGRHDNLDSDSDSDSDSGGGSKGIL
jgi:hypothetical protein